MKMEIVLTEEEVKNLCATDIDEIENDKFNKCNYCGEFNSFLKHTFFMNGKEKFNTCESCDKNFEAKFYVEKELSKKEYFRKFIEEPFNKDICDSKAKILNGGVIFIDETNPDKELRYFIKQAINPEVMFEGNFKDFKFEEQLDKTLDLTETVKKDGVYILKAYYKVYKTSENPKRFLI